MRSSDLLRSALRGLWQQKARTLLTLTGVTVGACSLAFSLSLGVGLRAMIDREFKKRDDFWWVRVYAPERGLNPDDESRIPADAIAVRGKFTPDEQQRLRSYLVEHYRRTHPPPDVRLLTPDIIDQLKALPNIKEVRTTRQGYATMVIQDRMTMGTIFGGRLDRFEPSLESRLIAGRMPDPAAANECVVTEYLLYSCGLHSTDSIRSAIGKPVAIQIGDTETSRGQSAAWLIAPGLDSREMTRRQSELFERIIRQVPDRLDAFDLSAEEKTAVRAALSGKRIPSKPRQAFLSPVIVGVLRGVTREESKLELSAAMMRDYYQDVFLPPAAGDALFAQLPETVNRGFREASVYVEPGSDLRAAVDAIETTGVSTFSTLKWFESARLEVTLISVGLNVFAMVSLLISAIGITNTLVTSVLERTREIGILKSLGATDGTVMALFLGEGAAVGLLGGLFGIGLARLLAGPADRLVHMLVQKVAQNRIVSETVFDFPLWLTVGTIAFAAVVTTLAAWYPARRAARIEPVEALRHE